jgi:NTE family protein
MSTYEKAKSTFRRIFKRKQKVGVAFGGGNSRGAAHAGVLKVLVENKIPIDLIAGTSSGAFIGALFAGGMSVEDIIKYAKTSDWLFKITRLDFSGAWPISVEGIEEFLKNHIGNKNIEALRIPFWIAATDYMTGEKVVLKKGNMARIVRISSSVPGVFAPVEFEGRYLMDGLMTDNVPADIAREMGADYVIAIDVVPDVVLKEKPKNIRQIIERAIDIASRDQSRNLAKYADVVILPVKENISPLDFNRGEYLIRAGEEAARSVIGKIKSDLGIS